MSAVDTLLGVVIGLVGALPVAVVVHLLDERREKNRLRRETALKPLEHKIPALKDAYDSLIDLTLLIAKAATNPQSDQTKLHEALDRFDISVTRAVIWMMESPGNLRRLMDGAKIIDSACLKLFSGQGLSQSEFVDSVAESFARVASAIGVGLGIPVLESQLRDFALRSSNPS